jgi:hypothetical protein
MRRPAKLALATLLVAGCSPPDGSLAGASPAARPVRAPQVVQEGAFDARGRRLGSGVRVAWLELPRGLTARPKGVNADVMYSADALSPSQVRDFLLPQMLTGSAEELGASVIYRGAMPVDGARDPVRLDVAVMDRPAEGGVLLRITPVSFPNVPAIAEPEARRTLAQEARLAE